MATKIGKNEGPRIPKQEVGMTNVLHFAFEFIQWADEKTRVTAEDIRDRWGVSRATSYRYLAAYRAFRGEP